MAKYRVCYDYMMSGSIEVEANTQEEAEEDVLYGSHDLKANASFMKGSVELSETEVVTDNEGQTG